MCLIMVHVSMFCMLFHNSWLLYRSTILLVKRRSFQCQLVSWLMSVEVNTLSNIYVVMTRRVFNARILNANKFQWLVCPNRNFVKCQFQTLDREDYYTPIIVVIGVVYWATVQDIKLYAGNVVHKTLGCSTLRQSLEGYTREIRPSQWLVGYTG